MKKFTLLVLVLLVSQSSISFSFDRVVLAEIYTSSTCPPCATQQPIFDNWLRSYGDRERVAVIKYHMSWPSPGNDPFYLANPTENNARRTYYGVNSVPQGYVNSVFTGYTASGWVANITSALSVTSPLDIKITGTIDSISGGTINVKVTSDNSTLPSGTYVLQVVVVESYLYYTGTNGDPVHNYVMRKMYPDANGETFTINPNQTLNFARNINWNTGWSRYNSEIIAFVQINETKQVVQAGRRRVTDICKDFNVASGWNIISVPLQSASMVKTGLFPSAASYAYGFSNGYYVADTLRNAVGYWMKFNSDATMSVCGTKVQSNQVPVNIGWNLIGVYDNDVQVSSITSSPSGIIESPFYGYNNGYFQATTIGIGKGVWVKVSQSGNLMLPTSYSKSLTDIKKAQVNLNWEKLILTDDEGKKSVLFLTKDKINLNDYEYPPIPPIGIFDVRFSSNRFVEKLSESGTMILINSAKYPLTIKYEGNELVRLKDKVNGKFVDIQMNSGDEFVITNPAINILQIENSKLPAKFELSQNYPNPFNPTTNIKFALPIKSNVKIAIYNLIGERIINLLEEDLEAGYHEINFDASNLPSGIYIYQMTTKSFVKSMKMVIIK